jgi:glycosyltransferase involved in cell wall biosynthesis
VDKVWLKKIYGDVYTVLFVAQLDKTHAHKGLDILITTLAALKKNGFQLRLIAVGKGDAIEHYKSLAKKEGFEKETVFTGFVEDEDLPKYYAGADVLVLPSTTSAEGFGMVITEANACGTPAIGSDIGGISQAIQNGKTGILVEPKNINALAEAVATFYNHPAAAERMGAAGAQRAADEFGWDHLVDKTEKILIRVLHHALA